jgi:CRP-like cAMP-binding protein
VSQSYQDGDGPVTVGRAGRDRVRVVAVASVEDVATVPLFGSLDAEQLSELASWFHVQHAGEGARLVGEGAHGYTFFVLTDGSAAVAAEGETLATLEPGDFFGEIAILGGGRRTATVTATTPVRLLVMFGTEFRQLEAEHPEIASRIKEAMQARLARASEPVPGATEP